MKTIYIFSGLGADHRVFQKIDFGENKVTHIPWIAPLQNESIEAYAKRISKPITDNESILIGLSFGGMMAMEVVKHIKVRKVILISSAKTKHEIPFLYKALGALKVHKVVPVLFMKRSNFISNWLFGVESAFDKNLLKQILEEFDERFLKWAINAIVTWENTAVYAGVKHIHGTKDRILPFKNVKPDFAVKNGGHFMVLNKAEEISGLLKQLI
ncbi:MAG TPA: alpha/beta hydrolase [Bacteroidia bacterium]|nr:alpha/beta hydrolase [Bacteroidia bacterium]